MCTQCAPLVTAQDVHISSRVGGSQQFYESISERAMFPISLLCCIHYTWKLHLFSMWLQLCGLLHQMQSQEPWGRKKTLCRSSFLLAAGEQIKETWRRSNSPTPPPFFPLSLSLPSSVCRQLVLSPKKSSWKWWTFQVLELVVGTYITQSFASVSLHPYISDRALRCGSSLIHWSALGWKVEVQW